MNDPARIWAMPPQAAIAGRRRRARRKFYRLGFDNDHLQRPRLAGTYSYRGHPSTAQTYVVST